jgi:hypothetical protein
VPAGRDSVSGESSRKPLYKFGPIAYVTNPLLALALEGSN